MKLLDIDSDGQRLYTQVFCMTDNTLRIVVHDISTEIPTVVQTGPDHRATTRIIWSTNLTTVSPERGRLYALGFGGTGAGANAGASFIEVYDLETLELRDTWEARVETPGFFPAGLVHDPDRDRIYLLGELGERLNYEVLNQTETRGTPPQAAIAAVDDTTGELIWLNRLDGCETPMNSNFHGAVVGLSAVTPTLYAFCAGAAKNGTATGQGGLLRLDLKEQGDAEGIVNFPSEFFPVSGSYSEGDGGVAGMDPVRERFFAHSLSDGTHGAWVFDGLRSSWIGFVAAPDNTNKFFGVDPATGKHYMAGEGRGGYLNVTDGGATPVPQGRRFEDLQSPSPWRQAQEEPTKLSSNVLVDPPTGRLFTTYNTGGGGVRGSLVLRDTTPPIVPRTPLDLDELTHELPDDDEARLEFSANTSGFGAQYVQVGGWENAYERQRIGGRQHDLLWDQVRNRYSDSDNPASIRYGNRGATMSLVEQIGIARSGASASAIATKPDDNTPGDAETKQNDSENQANEATGGGFDDLSDAVDDASSDDDDSDDGEVREARYVTCLDGAGEGEPVTDEQGSEEEPAHAKVVCDLAKLRTTAHARFSGGSGGGGVIVSDSSFDGKTYRDPERGVVTETEAIAEGIFFGEADLGGFSIDRVTSTATTWANGLDGTSHVRWVRTVEGMRTIEADGTAGERTSCTTTVESGKEDVEEGDCKSLQERLNDLIPNRFEVRFPKPEVVATPGGAFASVQENETDFLSGQSTNNDERRMVPGMEMTVFADGPQRGRLWVQLAAVKADATFIRSPDENFEFGESGGSTVGTGGSTGGDQATGSQGASDDALTSEGAAVPPTTEGGDAAPLDPEKPVVMASHEARLVGAFGWLPALRSAGDAVLAGALYLVFLLPVAEIVRRRRLLDVLTDAAQADARPSQAKASAPLSMSPVRSTS